MLTPGAYDPRFMKPATLCRCGHILECCADCMGWLRENSARIAEQWRARLLYFQIGSLFTYSRADAAEAYDIAYYELQRRR